MNASKSGYNRFLLLVAGLGGLLFGIDVGIISGALPYLQATSGLNANSLSFVAAAVLLGGVFSTLFAGLLSDLLGRKRMMILSGALFVVSVPTIALSHSFEALVFGRVLQGISGGLIAVVVPLYLAECLAAADRGKGTGIFQWLLTLGFVFAALIGLYFSSRVEEVAKLGDAQKLFAIKDSAWRGIFWVSLPPGIIFVIGACLVSESPRWLFRQGRREAARAALLRSRPEAQAEIEFREMEAVSATEKSAGSRAKESLLQRKYVIPFLLACIILACNQATGVNSIIIYNTAIFIQAGFTDKTAHLCTVFFTITNFLATIGAIALVDRKGRKFLLTLGTGGVIVSLVAAGVVFKHNEAQRLDVKDAVQDLVDVSSQTLTLDFDTEKLKQLLPAASPAGTTPPRTLVVIYSYGDFRAASKVVRSDEPGASLAINRASCVPVDTNAITRISSFVQHPLAGLEKSRNAPLVIDNAILTPVPSTKSGVLTASFLFSFMIFFALGPGVCVWLALSELMPTRIRSNGMSVALLLKSTIATTIAAVFLPTVGRHGYSTMFFMFAGCTVIYFVTAAFFLPETKGKTLEEIEAGFAGGRR
jgi:MFS family permease